MNSDYEEIQKKLNDLHKKLQSPYKFTDNDRRFVLTHINSTHERLRISACALGTEMRKPMLLTVLKKFDTFKETSQTLLYLFLSTTNHVEAFTFLLDRLILEPKQKNLDMIMRGLCKTEYLILPLIMSRLYTDDLKISIKLQTLIKKMGFAKVETFLSILPQIPHERTFRVLFGNKKIDKIKHI
jgi:hypothetical protein